jgi:outer membrane immunogenic protein
MNRIVAAVGVAALTAVFSHAAFAADLPPRVEAIPYKAPALVPVFTWTGFYLGGEVGGGWATDKVTNVTGNLAFPPGFVHAPNHPDGVLGGIYGGYNYQIGPWVLGVDGDYTWAGLKGRSVDVGPTGSVATANDKVDWVATATRRGGYAM